MKKNILIIVILSFVSQYVNAQFIDKFGFNIGATYSNQLWDYKSFTTINPKQDYKTGLSFFISAEKEIIRILSVRSELGYIQKGFKNNIESIGGNRFPQGVGGKNVNFHDVALNLEFKIKPFHFKWSPYALIGLRGDYMISHNDIALYGPPYADNSALFKTELDAFNKANLGGLAGIGLEFNERYYLEFEYNPAITSSYNIPGLEIKDNCWDFKLGLNINKLIQK